MAAKKLFTQIFIYFSKPLRLLYSLIIYEIVNFSFFTLYSLLLLSFFLYLKSVPIYVIVHTATVAAVILFFHCPYVAELLLPRAAGDGILISQYGPARNTVPTANVRTIRYDKMEQGCTEPATHIS